MGPGFEKKASEEGGRRASPENFLERLFVLSSETRQFFVAQKSDTMSSPPLFLRSPLSCTPHLHLVPPKPFLTRQLPNWSTLPSFSPSSSATPPTIPLFPTHQVSTSSPKLPTGPRFLLSSRTLPQHQVHQLRRGGGVCTVTPHQFWGMPSDGVFVPEGCSRKSPLNSIQ